jgi:hypothetical protein
MPAFAARQSCSVRAGEGSADISISLIRSRVLIGKALHARRQLVRDFLSDGERRGGAGAGSVQHMQRAIAFDEPKILHHLAILRDGLRTNARASRRQIFGTNFRHQGVERPAEELLAEGAAQLVEAYARVFLKEAPKSGISQSADEIAR